MKKSKLIELLNSLKGDPEIKLWNGMVEDWMDIKPELIESDLVKMTEKYWLESCRLESCIDRKDWDYQLPPKELAELKKNYNKVCKWELNPFIYLDDVKEKRYDIKNIYILTAKVKGIKSYDRVGTLSY